MATKRAKKKTTPKREHGVMTRTEIARALRKATRTIDNWREDGCPQLADGRYQIGAVVDWLLDRKEQKTGNPVEEHEARFKEARADRAELDLAERRAELHPVRDCLRQRVARILEVRKALMQLPRKLARRLWQAPSPSYIEEEIDREVRAMMESFARGVEENGQDG